MKAIGANLKKLREGNGYNQQNIAGFLGVDQSLISKFENGERCVSSDMLDRLASLFGVPTAVIINDAAVARPLSCAFRCSELTSVDMEAISAVNKIVLNSEFMNSLLEAGKRD